MSAGIGRRHLASLDLLRVAAMLWIVGFWHLMNYAGTTSVYRNEVTTRITIVVLATFTMLSGYLLGLKPVAADRASIIGFYRRRMLRIYPPLVAALAVFVLLGITDVPTALRSAFLVSEIVGPPPLTLWYVVMLALFYGVTPLLTAAATPAARTAIAVGVTLALAALVVAQPFGTDPRTALYFPSFAIGLLIARHPALPPAAPLLAALAGGLAIGLTVGIPVPALEFSLAAAPMATLLALALLLLALRLGDCIPASPLVTALGGASFFIYLVHRPVYETFARVLPAENTALRIALLVLVGLPLVLVVGGVGQRAYDALLRRLRLG